MIKRALWLAAVQVPAALAACRPENSSDECINVTCNTDETITVDIGYYLQADILEITYGNCTVDDIAGASAQNTTALSWQLTLDINRCNMAGHMRNIAYLHNAVIHVGRKREVGAPLSLAHFHIDAFCEFEDSYQVVFSYGQVASSLNTFDEDAGKFSLEINVDSYSSDFESLQAATERAGLYIYLGFVVADPAFNHADKLWGADSGKIFTPRRCVVEDTQNNYTYLLFDVEFECENTDIDLTLGFIEEKKMWTISHILFLLGESTRSTFLLRCLFHVCDVEHDTSKCAVTISSCFAVDGSWSAYGNWSECTAQCGNGTQFRRRSCTDPAPDFAGAPCSGASEESMICNTGACPANYSLAAQNECEPNRCQNGHECHDLLGDYACGVDIFGDYECTRGWKGKNCDEQVNPCDAEPCHEDGAAVCKPLSSTDYECFCHEGWRGDNCDDPPMDIVEVPSTLVSSYVGKTEQELKDGGIEDMIKTAVEGAARADMNLTDRLEAIKDWSYSYQEANGATVLTTSYTLVIIVIPFEVDTSDSDRRRRQAENTPDDHTKQHVEDQIEDLNNNLEEPTSDVNTEISSQVSGHQPQSISSDTENMKTTRDEDACVKGLHGGASPCLHGGVCKDNIGSEFKTIQIKNGLPKVRRTTPVAGRDFECECGVEIDYDGDLCDIPVDDCADIVCQNGGTCEDSIKAFKCSCPTFPEGSVAISPYNGAFCDEVDHPCRNGGTLSFDSNNINTCSCTESWTDEFCETEVDLDACQYNFKEYPCKNGGVCEDNNNGYDGVPELETHFICVCDAEQDFGGPDCTEIIDQCENHACENGATCVDGVLSYTCECPDWGSDPLGQSLASTHPSPYSGEFCQHMVNVCENGDLEFDESATGFSFFQYSFKCSCDSDWTGDLCEVPGLEHGDGCALNPCQNGGTCSDLPGRFDGDAIVLEHFTCQCDASADFEGDLCDEQIDDCENECAKGEACTDGVRSFTCTAVSCEDEYYQDVSLVRTGDMDSSMKFYKFVDFCKNPHNPVFEDPSVWVESSCEYFVDLAEGYHLERNGKIIATPDNRMSLKFKNICPVLCQTCTPRKLCTAKETRITHRTKSAAFQSELRQRIFCDTLADDFDCIGKEFQDCSPFAPSSFKRAGEILPSYLNMRGCRAWKYSDLCPARCGKCRLPRPICATDIDPLVQLFRPDYTAVDDFHDFCHLNYICDSTSSGLDVGYEYRTGSKVLITSDDGPYTRTEMCPVRCGGCTKCSVAYNNSLYLIDADDSTSKNSNKFCEHNFSTDKCDDPVSVAEGSYLWRDGFGVVHASHNNFQDVKVWQVCPNACGKCTEAGNTRTVCVEVRTTPDDIANSFTQSNDNEVEVEFEDGMIVLYRLPAPAGYGGKLKVCQRVSITEVYAVKVRRKLGGAHQNDFWCFSHFYVDGERYGLRTQAGVLAGATERISSAFCIDGYVDPITQKLPGQYEIPFCSGGKWCHIEPRDTVIASSVGATANGGDNKEKNLNPVSKLWEALFRDTLVDKEQIKCPDEPNNPCDNLRHSAVRFTIDLQNPEASDFCQFTELLSMAVIWPPSICGEIVKCIASMIRKEDNSAADCVRNILSGLVNDAAKSFSGLVDKLKEFGSTTASLAGEIACSDDPSPKMSDYVEEAVAAVEMFASVRENVTEYFSLLGNAMAEGLKTMGNGKYVSVLISKDKSFQMGKSVETSSQGIFCTFRAKDAYRIFEKLRGGEYRLDMKKRARQFKDMLRNGKYGYWEGIENEITTDAGYTVGNAGTVQILAGDSDTWGGHGFAISVGVDTDFIAENAGIDVGLVFAAAADDNGNPVEPPAMGNFIGFALTVGATIGPSNPFPFAVSISCAHVSTIEMDDECLSNSFATSLANIEQSMEETRLETTSAAKSLWKKCKKAWLCDFSTCENPITNTWQNMKQCGTDMYNNCLKEGWVCMGKWVKRIGRCAKWAWKAGKKCIVEKMGKFCKSEKKEEKCKKKKKRYKKNGKEKKDGILRKLFRWVCNTVMKCIRWGQRAVSCLTREMVKDNCLEKIEDELKCTGNTAWGCIKSGGCSAGTFGQIGKDLWRCGLKGADRAGLIPWKAACKEPEDV